MTKKNIELRSNFIS